MANTRSSIGSCCRGPRLKSPGADHYKPDHRGPGALRILVRREHPIAVGEQLAAEALGEQREPTGVVGASRLDELGLVRARSDSSVGGRLLREVTCIGPLEKVTLAGTGRGCVLCLRYPVRDVDPLPPYGVYSIPEAAMVGMTEAAASQQGIDITFNVPTFSRHTSTPPTTDSNG